MSLYSYYFIGLVCSAAHPLQGSFSISKPFSLFQKDPSGHSNRENASSVIWVEYPGALGEWKWPLLNSAGWVKNS